MSLRSDDPDWRKILRASPPRPDGVPLALGFELRERTATVGSSWAPRRTETVTPARLRRPAGDVHLAVRPLQQSTRTAAWIQSGVSWEVLRRPGLTHRGDQARWFAELHALAQRMRTLGPTIEVSEWIVLDTVESRLLWTHLVAAETLGIPFVGTKRFLEVQQVADADLEIGLDGRDGGFELTPRLTLGGMPTPLERAGPLGSVGVYAYAFAGEKIVVRVAPLPPHPHAHALLSARRPVVIPAADADEFLSGDLPALRRWVRVVAGSDTALPEPAAATLRVRVVFRPKDVVEVRVAWHYPGAGELPFAGAHAAPARGAVMGHRAGLRDPEREAMILAAVSAAWPPIDELDGSALTLLGIEAAEFAANALPALESIEGLEVEISGTRRPYHELDGVPEITVTSVESTDPDWFDLGIVVTIDGRTIPFGPLFAALSTGRRKLLLSDGGLFSLDHPALDRLRELLDEAGRLDEWETGPRISRYQTALWAEFEDLADQSTTALSWRPLADGLRDAEDVTPTPAPTGLGATLRPYQKQGYDWLAFLWRHRLGGILADDMGLGKTVQMLALVMHAREQGTTAPFLVVAPTSVLATWRDEAARFAPGLRVEVVAATSATRGTSVPDAAAAADIVVTSYAVLRLDAARFAELRWAALVLDEAQFVKNHQTKLYRAVRDLAAEVTFVVTGTPLENNLGELWSLLSLAAPGLFPSSRRFREEYVKPIEHGAVPENTEGGPFRAARIARLRRRIRPFLLRRTKELVAAELPAKSEQELRVELSPAHRARYDTVLQRERQKVLGLLDDLDRNRFIVFRSLTLLRMLALAPGLIDPADAHLGSRKLDALLERLERGLAEGHRALVFSQYTSFLSLAAERLRARGIDFASLDGATRDRERVVSTFRDGPASVFLISLKAGGFGLTLTEADDVFLLDPWWNPAAESQAVDRAHRIGQTRPVSVYRLIADGTIEEKVMALQRRKARLFRAVMDDDALFGGPLTSDDIRGLFEP